MYTHLGWSRGKLSWHTVVDRCLGSRCLGGVGEEEERKEKGEKRKSVCIFDATKPWNRSQGSVLKVRVYPICDSGVDPGLIKTRAGL